MQLKDYCDILKSVKSIAVVGISDKLDRDSGQIALMLKNNGYNVVGVHPKLKDVFGIPVYPSLKDIPHEVDLVDVFLNSERIPELLPDVKDIAPKYLWLQLGITSSEAEKETAESNIGFIQNRCIAVEFRNCTALKGLN